MKRFYLLITSLLLFNAVFCQWGQVENISSTIKEIHYKSPFIFVGKYKGVFVNTSNPDTFILYNNGLAYNQYIFSIETYGDTVFCNGHYSTNHGINWTPWANSSGYLLVKDNFLFGGYSYFVSKYSLITGLLDTIYYPVQWCVTRVSYKYQNEIYFGTINDSDNGAYLFRSTDDGQTLSEIFHYGVYPAGGAVDAITKVNDSILIIGGPNIGVLYSIDNGLNFNIVQNTWSGWVHSLQNVDGLILLGCDQGVYISYDTAKTFQSFNTGFSTLAEIWDIKRIGDYIYVGATNGLWRRPISDVVGIKPISEKKEKSIIAYYFNNQLHINTSGIEGKFEINIFDINGKKLYNGKISTDKSITSKNININELPAGIYIVKIFNEDNVLTGKFVVH